MPPQEENIVPDAQLTDVPSPQPTNVNRETKYYPDVQVAFDILLNVMKLSSN